MKVMVLCSDPIYYNTGDIVRKVNSFNENLNKLTTDDYVLVGQVNTVCHDDCWVLVATLTRD